MTDPHVQALATALRTAGLTDVDTATRRRGEYSSDASNYRVVPQVVAYPRHADEIVAAVATCRELGVPLTMRGGGTSIAGNAVGSGVVLDTSRHLNRVLALDPGARTAVVEPGTVLDTVTAAGRPHGLKFGPDPSTHSRATIAGSIGNNACGAHAMSAGRTGDNVVALDVVTAGGERFTAGPGAAGPVPDALRAVVTANLATIRTEFGRFRRQVSGYSLEHLLPENGFDVGRFLAGTEGTLAVVLQATVRLVPVPAATALVVLGYAGMAEAADAVPGLLPHAPLAVEGMDARLVDVVRRRRGPAAVPDLPRGQGWTFVEVAGATPEDARAAGEKIVADSAAVDALVVGGAAAAALWRIREDGAGLGGRTPAGEPAWPGWEDAAVPPERLGAYLREFETLLRSHRLDSLVYGHFGDGCVHARIDFPFSTRPEVFRRFVTEAADVVAGFGGSMSGEHGDGRARGELLPRMYSPAAIAAFGAVKHAFDPAGLLNPGVIVDPAPLDVDLRVPAARPLAARGFALAHDRGDLGVAAHRCVGVGKCRADTTASGGVMCPSYLATRDEKDSTRARARILQEAANGTLVRQGLRSAEVAESLDLCLSCKGCSVDCPAGVDMATYKSEMLHQKYRRRIRPASHYSLGWLPRLATLASRAPRVANAALGNGLVAAVAKWAGGIDARRPLPRFAEQTFRSWFAGRPAGTGDPVVLFVDTFTDHFSPHVGRAAVTVLEDAGYAVRVTPQPVCCGLTWISTGQLDGARRQLRRTTAALASFGDVPVVGLEPSCTAVLRSDAVELLPGDPHAASVAAATVTLAELLTRREGWSPPDLHGVAGVAQPHCHQHAVMGWEADRALLAAAGAQVTAVGGCCGLAGNFGVERGHYEVSVAVAETALLPAVRAAGPQADLLADGFSCRTQLDQLAGRPGRHLAEVLADALAARGRMTP